MTRSRKPSNFSLYLCQKLAVGASNDKNQDNADGQSDNLDLNSDGISAFAMSHMRRGSFANESQSDIFGNDNEADGGNRDYDLDEIASILGVERLQKL